MKKSYYDVYDRGLDTVAVWSHNAPTLVVGEVSLAVHAADVASMSIRLLQCAQCEQHWFTAREVRDQRSEELHDLCTRACRLISGSLPDSETARSKLQAVYQVRTRSFRGLEEKGAKLVAAWGEVNTLRAGMQPPQPPLVVGTADLNFCHGRLNLYAQALNDVAAKESPLKTLKATFQAISRKVDQNNKRWYQAWLGQFAANSPERAALSQIETGSAQTAPGQAVFLASELRPNQVVRLTFGAARATRFTLWHKGPGDAAFTLLAENVTEPTFDAPAGAPGEHLYKAAGHNGAGSGAESLPYAVQVAQQAAA